MISYDAIKAVAKQIEEMFHPDKIVLFGSFAYGVPNEGSDVDLLVILPFEGRPFSKSLEILKAIARPFAIDLLARSPEDTERRYRLGDPLICDALDRGHTLYENLSS